MRDVTALLVMMSFVQIVNRCFSRRHLGSGGGGGLIVLHDTPEHN